VSAILIHLLIVWGLVILALVVARLVARRRGPEAAKPEYSVALGFVASSYGVLLGLLVAFGSNHYADVRHQAQAEATSMLSLWDALGTYPPQIEQRAQRHVICYMRAIRDDDWPSMEDGNPLQAPRALRVGDEMRIALRTLPTGPSGAESSAYGRTQGFVTQADTARQELLAFTQSSVPTVMWVTPWMGEYRS
jgi:hypothetical protein